MADEAAPSSDREGTVLPGHPAHRAGDRMRPGGGTETVTRLVAGPWPSATATGIDHSREVVARIKGPRLPGIAVDRDCLRPGPGNRSLIRRLRSGTPADGGTRHGGVRLLRQTILFGGVREGNFRFCSGKCLQRGHLLSIAGRAPDEVVGPRVEAIRQGPCPKCGRPGPVDVQTSYRVWSALLTTSWSSRPEICCVTCGRKAKLGGVAFSALLGWWGFPWGLLATPVQIARNLSGLLTDRTPAAPSTQLRKLVRLHLAAQLAAGASAPRQPDT